MNDSYDTQDRDEHCRWKSDGRKEKTTARAQEGIELDRKLEIIRSNSRSIAPVFGGCELISFLKPGGRQPKTLGVSRHNTNFSFRGLPLLLVGSHKSDPQSQFPITDAWEPILFLSHKFVNVSLFPRAHSLTSTDFVSLNFLQRLLSGRLDRLITSRSVTCSRKYGGSCIGGLLWQSMPPSFSCCSVRLGGQRRRIS